MFRAEDVALYPLTLSGHCYALLSLGKIKAMNDLPIIQKTYDLIKWYVPILNRLPRDHRFQLGNRMVSSLYELLESLVTVRYQRQKLGNLQGINSKLEVLRYQTRLLFEFELLSVKRFEFAGQQINAIGIDLGGWIKQQTQAQ